MNPKQRIVLMAGLLLVLCIGVFPPWRFVGSGLNGELVMPIDEAAGHTFLFNGPQSVPKKNVAQRLRPRVDGGLLLAEVTVVLSIIGIVTCGISTLRK